jgi:hypothetical protein
MTHNLTPDQLYMLNAIALAGEMRMWKLTKEDLQLRARALFRMGLLAWAKGTNEHGYECDIFTLTPDGRALVKPATSCKQIDALASEFEHDSVPSSNVGLDDDTEYERDLDRYERELAQKEIAALALPGGVDHSDYLARMEIAEGPTEDELIEEAHETALLNSYEPTEEDLKAAEESAAHYEEQALSARESQMDQQEEASLEASEEDEPPYKRAMRRERNDLTFWQAYFQNRPRGG